MLAHAVLTVLTADEHAAPGLIRRTYNEIERLHTRVAPRTSTPIRRSRDLVPMVRTTSIPRPRTRHYGREAGAFHEIKNLCPEYYRTVPMRIAFFTDTYLPDRDG